MPQLMQISDAEYPRAADGQKQDGALRGTPKAGAYKASRRNVNDCERRSQRAREVHGLAAHDRCSGGHEDGAFVAGRTNLILAVGADQFAF